MLSMKTLNSNQEDLRRRALMILIISIPKAGERMLPTTPPLSYPPPPPPSAAVTAQVVKNLKFNVSIFITRFASKRYCMLRSTIIVFAFRANISYAPIQLYVARIDVQINITNSKFHTDLLSPWLQEIRFQNVHQLSVRFLQIPKPWH